MYCCCHYVLGLLSYVEEIPEVKVQLAWDVQFKRVRSHGPLERAYSISRESSNNDSSTLDLDALSVGSSPMTSPPSSRNNTLTSPLTRPPALSQLREGTSQDATEDETRKHKKDKKHKHKKDKKDKKHKKHKHDKHDSHEDESGHKKKKKKKSHKKKRSSAAIVVIHDDTSDV